MSDDRRSRSDGGWPADGFPRTAFVVSHTHWDREWYRTLSEFRLSLVEVVRQVLDRLEQGGEFRHFVLDGQSLVVEDHLEIRPEDETRIRELVTQGKLSLGPWYILPDEFLVSAESTVRNLQVGHRVAERFGGVQSVGYMPDSFGHIAQMPQILRKAGIDSFVYTRGNGDEIDSLGYEYFWCAPDGSEVLAINQCGGYCNAAGLGFEEIWHAHTRREVDLNRAVEQVRELFAKMRELSRGDVVLLNNGCDHFPPQQEFGAVLGALREAFPDTAFVHSGLEEYVAAVRELGLAQRRHSGELLGGRLHHILSGVWSARMPLKQSNDHCETLLAGVVEPFAAYGRFCLGLEYPWSAVDAAWRLLMQNHPHDSICGCSTDAVHREMQTRFDRVAQTGAELVRRQLERIAPTFAARADGDRQTVLCVANPLPEVRSEVVERQVVLQPMGIDPRKLRMFDERGDEVPFVVTRTAWVERFWGIDYRKQLDARSQREQFDVYRQKFGPRILRDESQKETSDCFLSIEFVARDLPPVGHANFFLREGASTDAGPQPSGTVKAESDRLTNEWFEVRLLPDGTFDLRDRRTGQGWSGLNRLEDVEDVGDEYDWSPATRTRTVESGGLPGKVSIVEDTGLSGRLRAEWVLPLPRELVADRSGRSDTTVNCAVQVEIGLRQGQSWVDVELSFDNQVRDHRLRTLFPTGIAGEELVSDGQFHVQGRAIERPSGDGWVQPPPATVPQQEFSLVQGEDHGLAVLARGLPEVEALRSASGELTLALTLLRAVEWLSRDDFPTRRHSNAGPTLHTPDAQCPGPHRFRYAVAPFAGDWRSADVRGISRRYRVPPLSIQGVEDGLLAGGRGLLSKTTAKTSISAIKRHETRDTLVVRLYNLHAEPVSERLQLGAEIAAVWAVDLLERRLARAEDHDDREIRLSLGAYEIVTLEIEFTPTSHGSR